MCIVESGLCPSACERCWDHQLSHADGHKTDSAFTQNAHRFTIICPHTHRLFASPISTARPECCRHKNPNTKICLADAAISKTCVPVLHAQDTRHLDIFTQGGSYTSHQIGTAFYVSFRSFSAHTDQDFTTYILSDRYIRP
jgi:hypothetical protein